MAANPRNPPTDGVYDAAMNGDLSADPHGHAAVDPHQATHS
jgi:hypothetical protein